MTWVCDSGDVCCAIEASKPQGMSKQQQRSKMESRSNRGLFLDLYLRTVSAGSRGRPNELDQWHQSMNRLTSNNPPPSLHQQTIDPDVKNTKKDKSKWSLGGFFRRRKKEDSDSSSGCEEIPTNATKKGFLSRKLRTKRQTTGRLGGAFDHVVVSGRDPVVLSDHSAGSNVAGEGLVRSSRESLASGTGSLESHHRRRKERVKARAEALRDRLKNDSSSDEEGTSPGGSSVSRFRSEDSLHGSLPRRGRRHTSKKIQKDDDVSYVTVPSMPQLRNSYSSSSVACSMQSGRVASPRVRDEYSMNYDDANVMHVQLPIGLHRSRVSKAPPPPPPRDPNRKYLNSNYDSSRPLSYAFENGDRSPAMRSHSSTKLAPSNERCNSEDHIALSEQWRSPNFMPDRPSSVSVEVMRPQVKRFITRHPSANDVVDSSVVGRYKYFADQTPRSRKPILATPFTTDQNYDSSSVSKIYRPPPSNKEHNPVRSASDFWRMKDQEEASRRAKVSNVNTSLRQLNDFKPMDQNKVSQKRNVFPRCAVRDIPLKSDPNEHRSPDIQRRDPPVPPQRKYTPNRTSSGSSAGELFESYNGFESIARPKSTNLEDALSELEAIYKSLKLSDEDLLDRAERLDVTTPVFDKGLSNDMQVQRPVAYMRMNRRSTIPDKITDDMAYRRLHPKERQPSQECTSPQISYLSASPLASRTFDYSTVPPEQNGNEPNITLDDVVYRNVRHANHSLKVKEPQPPFGIPLGPVVPGANSDYLHAAPKNNYRLRFMPRKSPDIVSDDLAYRNLRKDHHKSSALPPIKPINDEVNRLLNNNNFPQEEITNTAKKKRAVRSMSANVYNLLHQHMQSLIDDDEQDFEKAQSLSNVNGNNNNSQSKTLPPGAKLVASDTEVSPLRSKINGSPTSTETLTSSRGDLNGLRSPVKIPNKREEDFLTALAEHAKDATEKIDKELRELRSDIATSNTESSKNGEDTKSNPRVSDKAESPVAEIVKPLINNILNDIDQVSERAKQFQHKLETAINDQKTEDSEPRTYCLVPTVDSGNTTEQSDVEEVDMIDNSEELVFTSVSSLLEKPSDIEENIVNGSKFLNMSEKCKYHIGESSDNDYDNVPTTVLQIGEIDSGNEILPKQQTAPIGSEMKQKKSLLKSLNNEIKDNVEGNSCENVVDRRISDINANETKINEITNSIQNNILSITELLKNCENPKETYKFINLNKDLKTKQQMDKDKIDPISSSLIKDLTDVSQDKCTTSQKSYVESKQIKPSKSSDDSDTPDYANVPQSKSKTTVPLAEMDEDTSEYNSAEELAMIFGKDDSRSKSSSPPCKSPELQMEVAKHCGKQQVEPGKQAGGNVFTNSDSTGGLKGISENLDANIPPVPWYCDPRQVLIVTAYGLACVQQFSGLDLFVLLSILLAVISVIAMLLI